VEPQIRIRSLERSDLRDRLDSGEPSLDTFLKVYAGQNQWRHHIAVTYAAVEESTRVVVGFVTVAAGAFTPMEARAAKIPTGGYPEVPVLRVARFAVDRRLQGLGLGAELLRYAMNIAVQQAELVGCAGIVADTKPSARAFYERFGFLALDMVRGQQSVRPRLAPLFLELEAIKAALEDS
jgi:GNAT superfamily N-acetyltransferase